MKSRQVGTFVLIAIVGWPHRCPKKQARKSGLCRPVAYFGCVTTTSGTARNMASAVMRLGFSEMISTTLTSHSLPETSFLDIQTLSGLPSWFLVLFHERCPVHNSVAVANFCCAYKGSLFFCTDAPAQVGFTKHPSNAGCLGKQTTKDTW